MRHIFIGIICFWLSSVAFAEEKAAYCEELRQAIDYLMVGPLTAGLRKEHYYLASLKMDLKRAEQLALIYLARCKN